MRISSRSTQYLRRNGCSPGPSMTRRPLQLRRQQSDWDCALAIRPRRLVVGRLVLLDPRNAVLRSRPAAAGADTRSRAACRHLRVPRGRAQLVVDEARRRRPAGQRHVRRRVGRHGRRIDRDVEAVPLQLARGGEADDARAEHRRFAFGMRQREIGGHRRRAPRQRHARAAVAEVVDERLAIELLGAQHEPGRPMRAQADGGADDAVPRYVDDRQNAARLLRQRLRLRRRCRGRAAFERESERRHAAKLEKRTTIHARDSTTVTYVNHGGHGEHGESFLNASAA